MLMNRKRSKRNLAPFFVQNVFQNKMQISFIPSFAVIPIILITFIIAFIPINNKHNKQINIADSYLSDTVLLHFPVYLNLQKNYR